MLAPPPTYHGELLAIDVFLRPNDLRGISHVGSGGLEESSSSGSYRGIIYSFTIECLQLTVNSALGRRIGTRGMPSTLIEPAYVHF